MDFSEIESALSRQEGYYTRFVAFAAREGSFSSVRPLALSVVTPPYVAVRREVMKAGPHLMCPSVFSDVIRVYSIQCSSEVTPF